MVVGGAGVGAARDGRDAVDEGEGLGDVIDIGRGGDDFEWGAASVADQVVFAACLLPVDWRRAGVGPPFSRGCGSHPRTRATSRVRRPRSVRRAGSGAVGRKPLPSAIGPGDASTSALSRTPSPAAAVARLRRCKGRTECPADRAGPTPAEAPVTAPATAAATALSEPTTHRPRSTVEYPHPHERPNRHTGNAQAGHFNKIVSLFQPHVEVCWGTEAAWTIVAMPPAGVSATRSAACAFDPRRRLAPGRRCHHCRPGFAPDSGSGPAGRRVVPPQRALRECCLHACSIGGGFVGLVRGEVPLGRGAS